MAYLWRVLLPLVFVLSGFSAAQEAHSHAAPEKLGKVSFPTSCEASVQQEFERGVALLHSFTYEVAEKAFQEAAQKDPGCAMAHWGIAMTHFHQLWEPQIAAKAVAGAQAEIQRAQSLGAGSQRERDFIHALALIYEDAATAPYLTRLASYERAMKELAAKHPKDVEAQVFYALSLLASALPTDKSHARQKQAAELLEPLFRAHRDHPGIPHYLIHAYDNAELANKGLPAARIYSKIAPSAPHALHMPSHIFTRLGLWEDSIRSNLAAKAAAQRQGDTGEELHAMDYLLYAYLQSGREAEGAQVIAQLKGMQKPDGSGFKIGYAATAMPVRWAVERRQWAEAANIVPMPGAPAHVVAIAVWARGIGLARGGHAEQAQPEIERLRQLEDQLGAAGNQYWADQTGILRREVMAWVAQAANKAHEAVAVMRQAADEEDAMEKLPVTPGPIVPAREQLGELLLEQKQPGVALKEFQAALVNAPGRRGALQGVAHARELSQQARVPGKS